MRGRKPKYDYTSSDFLNKVELMARSGSTDKAIAISFGLHPHRFEAIKSTIPEVRKALNNARWHITPQIRARYIQTILGGQTASHTSKKENFDGSIVIITETVTELPPNVKGLENWLRLHDSDWQQRIKESKKKPLRNDPGVTIIFSDKRLTQKEIEEMK